jgi:hypothetical protein
LWDFYNKCQVGGIDNLCFFGDHFIFGDYLNNGQVFFVVWYDLLSLPGSQRQRTKTI